MTRIATALAVALAACGTAPSTPQAETVVPITQVADGSCAISAELPPGILQPIAGRSPTVRAEYRHGRLTSFTRTGESGEYREELDYDADGRLQADRAGQPDRFHGGTIAGGTTYRYQPDSISETRPYGETLDCALDRAHGELRCIGRGGTSGGWTQIWRYDPTGRLLSDATHSVEHKTSDLTVVRTYDDDAHTMTETRDFDSDGVVDREELYSYDTTGRLLAGHGHGPTATSDHGTWTTTYTYTFDAAGRVACATTDETSAERMTDTRCYAYDSRGNVIRITRDGVVSTMTYAGDFHDMQCGHLARPDREDDDGWTHAGQVWNDQVRAMFVHGPC